MPKQRYRVNKREWLNDDRSMQGFVIARVPNTERDKFDPEKSRSVWVESEFRLGDCGRSISLDFNIHDAESIECVRAKADLLLDIITEFNDAVHVECDLAEERLAAIAEYDKNKRDSGSK